MNVTIQEAREEDLIDPVVMQTPGTTTRHQIEEIRKERRLHTRARTMAETAKEAAEFLKQTTGTQEFLKRVIMSNAPETRGRTKARELLADILSHASGDHDEEDSRILNEKAKRSSLHMTFHLFDHEGTGKVNEEQLAEIFRSLGLRPLKRKIRAIMAELDTDKTGYITEEDFVDHMIHLHDEEAKKPEESSEESNVPHGWGEELEDGTSVFDYYGSAAGMVLAEDAGESGSIFNLGVDGAFKEFRLIAFVGSLPEPLHRDVEAILQRLGIQVTLVTDLRNLVRALPVSDAVWVFSGPMDRASDGTGKNWEAVNEDAFVRLLRDYHYSGRGIAVFSTGFPVATEANALTNALFGFKLDTDVDPTESTVTSHQLMSGVSKLGSGPAQQASSDGIYGDLKIVSENATKNPTVLCKDFAHTFGIATPTGRIVVDTAASRFFSGDEDSRRYAANAAVWLLGLDYRIGNNYPPSGSLIAHDADMKHVWQYKHGGWYNYDKEASQIVEERYQEYVQNPYKCDVREVQSGHWKYMVDFVNMKQTNTVHPAHTTRDIRRVPVSAGVE